jgi:DNA polymerase-1
MFCKLYGGGIKKVAYLTGTDYDEALKFVNEFDHRVPGVSKYMQRMSNVAIRDRKIVNPFGRIYFMEPNFAYKAVNYMVQGTSADILKEAMLRIDTLFRTKWEGCHILLTLHDELVLEIPKRLHSVSLQRDVITAMNQDYKKIGCPIPLPVEMKIAKERWSKTTDIKSRIEEWKEAYVNKRRNT